METAALSAARVTMVLDVSHSPLLMSSLDQEISSESMSFRSDAKRRNILIGVSTNLKRYIAKSERILHGYV
jgi:hypothetical protein